jgi:hypothetical protein
MGGSGQLPVLAVLPSGKKHFTLRIAGWIGPKDALDVLKKRHLLSLPGGEPRTFQPRSLVTAVAVLSLE